MLVREFAFDKCSADPMNNEISGDNFGSKPIVDGINQTPALAVLALLASAALWGISWYPFRLLAASGVSGVWAIIATELIAAVLCLIVFWPQLVSGCNRVAPAQAIDARHAFVTLALIGFLGGATNTGFILATLHGNVLRATLLLYLAPLWTLFLARWLLKEPITSSGVGVVLMALGGAAVMLGSTALHGGLSIGDGLGLIAGISYAAYNVSVRHAEHIPQAQKTLAAALGSAATAALALPFYGAQGWPSSLSLATWILLLGTAILLVLVVSLMQYGLMRVSATRAIVILVSELIFAAGSAWWLAGEIPGTREFIGGALIISASLIAAGIGRHEEKIA